MSGVKLQFGIHGEIVAANIRRVRTDRNLTYAEVARRVSAQGYKLPVLAITRVEELERRVSIDDLYAFAEALDVGVEDLLSDEPSRTTLLDLDRRVRNLEKRIAR